MQDIFNRNREETFPCTSVQTEQSDDQDEPLNRHVPISVLFPYLVRDYRAEQKKVRELEEELIFERRKKNEAREEVKRLNKYVEQNISPLQELPLCLQNIEKLKAENHKLRETLIRLRNILTTGKLADMLNGKKEEGGL